jgi:hypothetical protein
MTGRWIAAAALALALLAPRYVRAHEGHPHKIMGTVTALHEHHLQVKSTAGKTEGVMLNDKTKILRGTTAVNADAIKPGERIIVTAVSTRGSDGKVTTTATEIKLAPADAPAKE